MEFWIDEVSTNEESRHTIYNYLVKPDCASVAQQILQDIQTLRAEYKASKSSKRKGQITKEIGDKFENFVAEVFSRCKVFKVVKNVQSSTNQLDFVLELEEKHNLVPFLREAAGTQIFGEAKCYTKNEVSGEWASKLSTILDTSNGKLAFLIIANAQGVMKNNQLKRKFDDGVVVKRIILPLGQDFIQQVLSGKNILKILEAKYNHISRREIDSYEL